jgi:gliding motility-associated-like protein
MIMLKSKELTSNVNASTRCRESLPIVLIALFLLFSFLTRSQVAVQTLPNTNCTGVAKKCEYTGPSILINEINISPSNQDGSLVTGSQFGAENWGEGEWIELYNPDECNSIDISGYMLGSYNSLGQRAGGGGGANGMGFILPEGSVVPPNGFVIVRGKRAAVPPPEVIDIVALELQNNICIEGGNTSRFWFANSGSWFAFYDRNGVVQDAITWGSPIADDLNQSPCIPFANFFPSSVTSVVSYNASGVGSNLGSSLVGSTYVRIPDGGSWSNSMANEFSSYGSCNLPGSCDNGLGSSTCNGSATLSPSFGSSPYTFLWDDALEQTSANATKLCAGSYNVTITDGNGVSEITVVVIENDFFEIDSLAVVQPNCFVEYGRVEVFIKGQSAANGNLVYAWTPSVSTTSIAENLSGGYYKINVHDDFCVRDTNVTILDREIKVSSYVDQPTACLEKPVNFLNFSTGVLEGTSSCSWDFGDGTSSTDCNPSHLYQTPGGYHVTLKIVDQFGCEKENTTYSMVDVNTLPVIDLGNDAVFCGNEWTTLNAGAGFVDYQWSNGVGGISTNTVLPFGEESVIVTDLNGCKGKDTIVLSSLPYPIFDLGDDLTFCEGGDAILNVPLTQVSYLWNTGASSSSIIITSTGKYQVEVTNDNGCLAADSMELFVVQYPRYANIIKDTLGCVGDVEVLTISTDGEQVHWSNNDVGVKTEVRETGTYIATSINKLNEVSCTLSDSIDVVFYSYVDLIAPDSFVYCFEFGKSLMISTPTIASFYDWDIDDNSILKRTTGPFEKFVYEAGTYNVAVYDHPFCQKIQGVVVQEKCPLRLYIPSAFTPDGDGMNDLFYPVAPNYETLEFTIFNRWGQVLFESSDGKPWNGTFHGKDVQQGVYVWKCTAIGFDKEYHGKTISKNGTVTLLR